MNDSALNELDLPPIQVRELAFNKRSQLLNFLLRWEQLELARGDTEGALTAYRRLNELRPQSCARDDWVTVSGYGVRPLTTSR